MIKVDKADVEMRGTTAILGAELGVAMLTYLDAVKEKEELTEAQTISVLLNVFKDVVNAHVTDLESTIKQATKIGIDMDELKKQLEEEKESE